MPKFSNESKRRLSTCDARLQVLFNKVIENIDCTILCGHRGKKEQDKAYAEGNSKVLFPHSKHNKMPSKAVDCVSYPIQWEATKENSARMYMFVGIVKGIASQMGIKIRCGADWDNDGYINDQNFHDIPHFELTED